MYGTYLDTWNGTVEYDSSRAGFELNACHDQITSAGRVKINPNFIGPIS